MGSPEFMLCGPYILFTVTERPVQEFLQVYLQENGMAVFILSNAVDQKLFRIVPPSGNVQDKCSQI